MIKPLEGLLVLEFCQFMAGPSAGLKLADLGARVIKIERPVKGEAGRQIAIKNLFIDGDSLVFHTINRNKESYAADLKNPEDLARVKLLIAKADVMTHNFRPGVMNKIGLHYDAAKLINPKIIYGVVSGYGSTGPWAHKPGQDLLVQSLSGLTWLSGNRNDGPVAFGLAVADILCGAHLTQGILAALIKRSKTKQSVLVEVSLLESILDFQFEVITTYLNDGNKLPERGQAKGSAHAYLSAPYGVYQTADGYISLAMGDLGQLGSALGINILKNYSDPDSWFTKRDEIIALLKDVIVLKTTDEWLATLEPLGIWCANVFSYEQTLQQAGYKALQMEQQINLPDGKQFTTVRCPIRINGQKLFSSKPAPKAGAQNAVINREFDIV